ncbi:D-alanine--D-alanine ligase [Candidatus Omnitrophota bacterium]
MTHRKLGTIGVLMGGTSAEREISCKSGEAVHRALKELHLSVVPLDITIEKKEDIVSFLKAAEISVAFIALHGRFGEDGAIQEILSEMGIPYTGSGILASRSAIDKVISNKIFEQHSIPIPRYETIEKKQGEDVALDEYSEKIKNFPVVIKPATQGSSIGVTVVKEQDKVIDALREAFKHDDKVVVQEYISGREMTVGVLEDNPLPIIEVIPHDTFFDFQAKYKTGLTDYSDKVDLPEDVYRSVQSVGLKAHQVLGCKDFSRVDLILHNGTPYVLEVNTIPGFTATSLLPKAAHAVDIDFGQLCVRLLELAYG